ncbi:nucleotide disphospho-sugar-binding domain-containing protein [Paludisphaera sp.]|uniref:glycosyltransferase n=1 Tax=Paludisphaera sp. TaxID=2017432 RepID=UPI00301D4BF8
MARIGFVGIPVPGHFYPSSALARKLMSRGHEVVYFELPDFEQRVRGAGLDYRPIGRAAYPPGSLRELDERLGRLKGREALRFTIERMARTAVMILDEVPAAAREARIDALVIDQCQVAGSTLAERLGVPYVSTAAALPINLDPSVPPFQFAWRHGRGAASRLRNRLGNWLIGRVIRPVVTAVDQRRREWGMAPLEWETALSRLAQVSQLPAALELPGRVVPPSFHHTGPWTDPEARAPVDFPWDRLNGRLLAYVSMGTLQNQVGTTFRTIAAACDGMGLQLAISLGGGGDPKALGDLPGDPIVVGFAPQLDLIRRSTLTISHGGLNTTLESLTCGVPTVVLPVTNDQPGVGVRVEAAGVGRSIPVSRATVPRVREAVRAVLDDPSYRGRAEAMRSHIAGADGLNRAADAILGAFGFATWPAGERVLQ